MLAVAMALARGAAPRAASESSGRTWPGRARSSWFGAVTGAACIRRWRSCRSCRSCRTPRAIPASLSTPPQDARDALSQFELCWRYPGAGGAVLLRPRQRRRAVRRARGGHLGAAGRGARRQARRHARRRRARASPPGCTCRIASAGATCSRSVSSPPSASASDCSSATALMPPGQLRSEINMGVLLSLAGLPLALTASWAPGVGRFAPKPAP